MKRVLSLSTLYPNATNPRFGTFVARSLEALARCGDWDVTIINPIGVPPVAFGKYAALKNAAVDGVEHGVKVLRPTFPLIPKFGGPFNPALIVWSISKMVAKLHAEQPFDVLDAQFFYPDGPAVARLAKKLNLPFSIKARGADIHYWGSTAYGLRQMQQAASQASGLLAVCGALADDMGAIGLLRKEITLHYTGLDRDRFRPLNHPTLRRKLGEELGIALPNKGALLATVGALIPRKGQEFVIGAMLGLPADTHLLLVGKGEDEARLKAMARDMGLLDRIHFLGLLDHNLLPVLLSAADLMVLPSASEGLANAWVEALACGTPLIITDAGGAREIVTSRDAGLIVERSEEAIREGIVSILADLPPPERVEAMAAQFSWQANGAALAAHLEKLTAQGPT